MSSNELVHESILKDIDGYAERAGLGNNSRYISQSAEGVLPDNVLKYAVNVKKASSIGKYGGFFTDSTSFNDCNEYMRVMTGLFIRNFIDAKIYSQSQLIQAHRDNVRITATVLLCPNFITPDEQTPKWKAGILSDFLVGRQVQGKQTVLYVSSLPSLKANLGGHFVDMIKGSYLSLDGGGDV